MAQLNFDASHFEPQQSFEPIPPGWYNCVIDTSEVVPTKSGTGAYLALAFRILDGAYVNRRVHTNLNIKNKNPMAQEIAFKQLSAICHAVGVIQCPQSELLHDKPLQIRVMIQPPKDGYDASNSIKAFKAIGSSQGNFQQEAPPTQQQWQPASTQPPPVQLEQQTPPSWQENPATQQYTNEQAPPITKSPPWAQQPDE